MEYTEIAIGVLKQQGKVCLSVRQAHQSFAGSWEFPGGKVAPGESIDSALRREFLEELAIETSQWRPLLVIPWHYDSVSVRLHVYESDSFQGEPVGNEGQTVRWIPINQLSEIEFPAANRGIVVALKLADHYMISGDFETESDALNRLQTALHNGIRLCQLRAKHMAPTAFTALANKAIEMAHKADARILLNGTPDLLELLPNADGIQLASNVIYDYHSRPIVKDKLLGVSTHSKADIQQALKIGADFLLLSPVKETKSHPGEPGIGWQAFADCVKEVPIPVFALGGMLPDDCKQAKLMGGHGVAAISGFWPAKGVIDHSS